MVCVCEYSYVPAHILISMCVYMCLVCWCRHRTHCDTYSALTIDMMVFTNIELNGKANIGPWVSRRNRCTRVTQLGVLQHPWLFGVGGHSTPVKNKSWGCGSTPNFCVYMYYTVVDYINYKLYVCSLCNVYCSLKIWPTESDFWGDDVWKELLCVCYYGEYKTKEGLEPRLSPLRNGVCVWVQLCACTYSY